jgi:hypothetical protein
MGDFEMMKKTTSALAVAALLGTGAASAATFQVNDDTTLNVSGNFFITYKSVTDDTGTDQTTFGDNGSDLIFSGEHAAANGLTTFFNLDLDGFDTTQADENQQGNVVDEASVGVRGGFGQVLVGSNTSAYDAYADFADIEQVGDRTSFSMGDQSDVIQYSNTLDNVDFMVSLEVGDNQGADDSDDGSDTVDDGSQTAIDVGASIDLGGVSLSGAYNDRAATDDGDAVYGFGASTTLGGVNLTVGHEIDDATNGIDKTSLTGSYGVGKATLIGSVQNVNYDVAPSPNRDGAEDSFTETYLGANYSVTSQMTLWGEVLFMDNADDEGDYTAVGVNYSW